MLTIIFAAVFGNVVPLVTCDDWRGWSHTVQASVDGGIDTVTIRLSSPTNAMPPQFGVQLRVPGAGVQNVWTADYLKNDGQHLWPQLWWEDRSTYESQLAVNSPIAVGYDSISRRNGPGLHGTGVKAQGDRSAFTQYYLRVF